MAKNKVLLIPKVSYKEAKRLGPRKFAEKYLFPAILREHGNGFAMSVWRSPATGEEYYDDLLRPAPSCHTVACIGGTLNAIVGVRNKERLGKLLGLDPTHSLALFYGWNDGAGNDGAGWSLKNQRRFAEARTPLAKAKIAINEVKLAIKTKGKSLEK